MSGRAATPTVERRYAPSANACTRAVRLLLERKRTIGPAPEPDSPDDAKESNGCIATEKYSR